jgi:hypothetical protein
MKNRMKNMIKRSIAVIGLLLVLTNQAQAQVFLMDEDAGGNIRIAESDFVVPVPYQGTDWDEYLYTPLGDGVLLLTALGGAYLLRKRKKSKD